ncbi:MAG: tetratricopeptide repeat protein, partial [Pedobacter sp.]
MKNINLQTGKILIFFMLSLWLCLTGHEAKSQENIDSLKGVLKDVLQNKKELDASKWSSIRTLEGKLRSNDQSPNLRYQAYLNLFNAYKSFIHDSAYVYSQKVASYAKLLNDNEKINYSKVNLGFVLVSSGMFKEGIDTLKRVNPEVLNKAQQFEYYFLMARANFDLTDYNKIHDFSELYRAEGLKYCDTIMSKYSKGSYEYLSGIGLKQLRAKQFSQAIRSYESLLKLKLSYRDSAINYSCLSYLYFSVNKPELGLRYLLKSSILDNTHSIKESLAMVKLAEYIYQKGETKEAFNYIHSAIEDNNFYGAKQRKVEISNILPIIEKDKINDIEKQKQSLLIYASIITLLIILTIYFASKTFRQLKKIRIADKLIMEKNHDLNHANAELLIINASLDVANRSLTRTNRKLDEVNLIKEEYIGQFFNIHSDYIDKLEKLKRSLEKIAHLKQYDQLQIVVKRMDTNIERESFFQRFDEVFLNLFPDFILDFNALFAEKDKTLPSPGQLMNNELRIFALIRLGIDENETIAKILNYSVNTIYTYKTKVKNRSLVANDIFKEKIMSI